jgi:hypothetical protein
LTTVLSPSLSLPIEPVQRVVRIGFVGPTSPSSDPQAMAAFAQRLRELG